MSTSEPTNARAQGFANHDLELEVAPRAEVAESRVHDPRLSSDTPRSSEVPPFYSSETHPSVPRYSRVVAYPDALSSHASPVEVTGNRRLIKRYSNRKLYDTHSSRYVTLVQIAEMVGDGENVKVVDNKTREDKTEFTFAQVILEQLKSSAPGVARVKLADLIRDCQRSRPGTKPVVESAPSAPAGHQADPALAWYAHVEDQLEQLPAAEAAAWRARLRDLNARLSEVQRSQAGPGLHSVSSSLE